MHDTLALLCFFPLNIMQNLKHTKVKYTVCPPPMHSRLRRHSILLFTVFLASSQVPEQRRQALQPDKLKGHLKVLAAHGGHSQRSLTGMTDLCNYFCWENQPHLAVDSYTSSITNMWILASLSWASGRIMR